VRFDADHLALVGVTIASNEPPTLRCQRCGHTWRVQIVGLGIEPPGAWFCPICEPELQEQARQEFGDREP